MGRALAVSVGSLSPDRLVARTRNSYVVPLARYPTVKEQQAVTGYFRRSQVLVPARR